MGGVLVYFPPSRLSVVWVFGHGMGGFTTNLIDSWRVPVFPDNRPPLPLRSLRFARFLSTGGENGWENYLGAAVRAWC